ncbi:lipopolysaccharide biosynthesis protein [Nitrosospira multiformis]|uniref:Membrane protein involved in the export of O-antigen and teichoic acid n=1 Tax=Nitrosospira multiformis TaxID=1231 RepID=A0A1I7GD91_9PROT|nr:lipopolysaccharide biosynthesis protein [Nitrosospira multiformis]SFU46452.1 Membrane protein involved in the export of O-antigen and teichoic acid [Nitrosospira multiformis]
MNIRRALGLSLGEKYLIIALGLLGNMALARLLTPEEIGLYSVNLAVIGLAQVLRDFGIGSYLVQVKDLSDMHIKTAFGVSLLIGVSLFFIVIMASPYAGSFYGEERLAEIMRLSAFNFLLLPFCTISLSLLSREMLFNRLLAVNLISTVASLTATVILAYKGFGATSMAVGALVGSAITGVSAWIARTERKILLPGFSEWRKIVSFGGRVSAANIVTTIAVDINDLAIGKTMGFGPVAMLSRAQGLTNMFAHNIMSALKRVAYPAFAKAHREGESLESRYIASVSAVTVLAWPFYGFASLYSLELLRLLFGPQWDEAATLMPIFCLAGAFAATSNLILTTIIAVGRADLFSKSELIFQPFRASLIVGAAVLFKSLMACAVAFLIAFMIHPPFLYAFKARCIPNDYESLFSNLWKSAKVSITTLIVPAGIAIYADLDRHEPVSMTVLGIALVASFITWLVSLIVFEHPVSVDPLFQRLTSRLPRFT